VKLFFLGVKHPNPGVPEMAMAARAVERAKDLDLYGRFVVFNCGWVPYRDRANYLLDADIGISSHLDTIETRFAFRTRLLDYFWAGLPTIATKGDVLSDLIRERNLGRAVGFGEVSEWEAAIEELADDPTERDRVRRNVERVRSDFAWRNVVEPLARLASLPGGGVPTRQSVPGATSRYFAVALEAVLRRRGVTGTAAEVYRALRRPPVP